ncbi:ATP synthase F1 subunit gamma [Candidatus Jorgensenbacteria bacterium]|nr:ATP synthase F1 subunit gamma [Candidatus Jorgensenbacteria bacterium]
MDSTQNIKTRLKAVNSVNQITKAMEVVAATKMRKAQEVALNSRPYAFAALELLKKLTGTLPIETTLTVKRPVNHTVLLVVASDRGLTGAFNTQVFRSASQFLAKDEKIINNLSHRYSIVAVGKKTVGFAAKRNIPVIKNFYGVGDYVTPEEVKPITDHIARGFVNGEWDRVVAISTHFRTTLKQDVLIRHVLPVNMEEIKKTVEEITPEHGRYTNGAETQKHGQKIGTETQDYLFEPGIAEIVDSLLPHLITMQIYHLILEANASEHSARRVAMKSASDNADELSHTLAINYNKARQSAITKEIIEITSTQSALT